MAMPPPSQQEQHHHLPNSSRSSRSIATNRWGPYSGAGDFASNMAVILVALLAALALALALNAAVRYLFRRRRRSGSGQGEDEEDPEKPPVVEEKELEVLPVVEYSASGTKLAGASAECAICLGEFVDGNAVCVMPACAHGFHARCIERWLAGGLRSSCPTCRAPTTGSGGADRPPQPQQQEASAAASS